MKRVFYSYERWEDFFAGQYELPSCHDSIAAEISSAMLLRSPSQFYCVAQQMISEWTFSAEANLSNRSRNRQAWIGQASCCYAFGAKEHQVKSAWHTLTPEEQSAANKIADEIVELWETVYA
jgi:hypothetical protein